MMGLRFPENFCLLLGMPTVSALVGLSVAVHEPSVILWFLSNAGP